MTRFLAAAMAVFLWAQPPPAHAEDPSFTHALIAVACPLEQIMADAERMQQERVRAQPPCIILQPPYPVVEIQGVIAGPLKDYEGDEFYVVQIKTAEGEWYTLVWPKINGRNLSAAPNNSSFVEEEGA